MFHGFLNPRDISPTAGSEGNDPSDFPATNDEDDQGEPDLPESNDDEKGEPLSDNEDELQLDDGYNYLDVVNEQEDGDAFDEGEPPSDNEDEPVSNDGEYPDEEPSPRNPSSSDHGQDLAGDGRDHLDVLNEQQEDALNEEDDDDGFDGEGNEEDDWWVDGPPLGMYNNDEEENPEDIEWWDEEEEEDLWEDDFLNDDQGEDPAFWEDEDGAFWEDDEDGFDDDISEASTLEPQEEADACNLAAETTRDRHLLHPPSGYRLPSATFHFQSADAVAVCEDPHCPGASLIATMDSDGVLLFRMPAAGAMTQTGGPAQPMEFVGGFESPTASAYSMEISPSGRFLLAGGDEGFLEIFAIDSRAPQRAPVPRKVIDDMSVHQPYFYLPIIPPESDWVTGSRPNHVAKEVHELLSAPEAAEMRHMHGNLYHSYPRTLNDATFLNVLGFRDAAVLLSATVGAGNAAPPIERPEGAEILKRAGLGWVAKDVFFAAAVDDQYRGLEHQFHGFADMIGGKDKIDWKIDEQVDFEGHESEHSTKQYSRNHSLKGAVVLAGIAVLGFNTEDEATHNVENQDGMVNGVRFGIVGGKERILAADQSGRVYIFETPPDDCVLTDMVQCMMCNEITLGDKLKIMPITAFNTHPTPLGASLVRKGRLLHTATLGPFGCPLNLAVASPDGKWIAIVGDQQKLILIDQNDGFSSQELSFEPKRFDHDFLNPDIEEVGAQYCAWNASSTLLAVTSDALHALFVFSIPSKQLVMRVEGFVRTVMPVMFAPWNDRVVIFGEETKMIHVRTIEPDAPGTVDINAREELADPGLSSQLIRIPADPRRPKGGRRRITGMATTAQGDVLVSTKQGIMYRYLPADEWVPEKMSDWPVRFRESAQTFLQCAARQGDGEHGLTELPAPVMQLIIKYLAGKKTDWLDILADPVAAEVAVEEEQQQQQQQPDDEQEQGAGQV
jgi:hypothetical protein